MNLFNFDMTKITWSAQNVGTNGFRLAGTQIKINNDEYFKQFVDILKNIVNTGFKLILVDKNRNESYFIDCIKIIGFNIINQKFVNNPTKDNVFIECVIREDAARFTSSTTGNYWLYLQYE